MKRNYLLGAALLALCVGFSPAGAQGDAVLRAKERAKLLTDFRALLESTDTPTRAAAFEEAMSGKDVALKAMAMDVAMGGTDANLKTAALRYYLNGRATLPITVLLPDRASDGVAKYFANWNGLRMSELVVKDDGTISGSSNGYELFRGGQLVSGGLTLQFNLNSRCTLTAKIASAKQLAGSLDCSLSEGWQREVGTSRITFPVRIDLP